MQYDNPPKCDWASLNDLTGDRKLIEGEGGWLFLTNDTNNQMAQQFGLVTWNERELKRATAVIEERENKLKKYKKFIIPGKKCYLQGAFTKSLKFMA